jgi:hypothetical protein
MSASTAIQAPNESEMQLPRRDWVFLPVIGLLTISLLALSTELIARALFPVSQIGLDGCFAADDPSGDAPARPDSVCSERIAESSFSAEYKFNHQGDRDDTDLRPKAPGTYRVVMIGSSFAMGLFVPREKTLAALLPEELSRRTGRKVEVYNEATGGKHRGGPFPIQSSALRFGRVLSAGPDMILWIMTPMDIQNSESDIAEPIWQLKARNAPTRNVESNDLLSVWKRLENAVLRRGLGAKLRAHWENARTSLALKHFLIASENPDQYTQSYLRNALDAEFLKREPNASWQHLLRTFQGEAAEFEKQAKTRNIPFVAVLIPNRAQAAMLSMGEWPQGYDPYALDRELRTLIESHGGTYIDVLPDFRGMLNPVQCYFPVDGHLNPKGHAAVAQSVSAQLTRLIRQHAFLFY